MYVAGFTGTAAATVNGWYAPYYNASLAPAGLQGCTNVGYNSIASTGSAWSGAFDPGWQTKGNPVGYFNVLSNVSDPTNTFWVRLLRGARPAAQRPARADTQCIGSQVRGYDNPLFANTQSFWNLVTGAVTIFAFLSSSLPSC